MGVVRRGEGLLSEWVVRNRVTIAGWGRVMNRGVWENGERLGGRFGGHGRKMGQMARQWLSWGRSF